MIEQTNPLLLDGRVSLLGAPIKVELMSIQRREKLR